MPHDVKMFVRNGKIVYIHHNSDDPTNDDPGEVLVLHSGKKVRFKSDDGAITITFKNEWPFESTKRTLTSPMRVPTPPETLKDIGPEVRKEFPYTAKVGNIQEDPEIIIDEGSGGPGKKKATKKGKKKAKKKTAKKKATRKKK